MLDDLETLQTTGQLPGALIGSIDWVTKKHLLDEAGSDSSWSARKKIDICYHELSPVGYFQMLQAAGLAVSLTDLEDVERAVRTPPANSPATMRGSLHSRVFVRCHQVDGQLEESRDRRRLGNQDRPAGPLRPPPSNTLNTLKTRRSSFRPFHVR